MSRWEPHGLVILLVAILAVAPFASWAITRGVLAQTYENNVGAPLRAADSTFSVDVAQAKLGLVITFLESRGVGEISGSTSLFVPSPDEDIGAWYVRLKGANNLLQSLDENSTQEQEDAAMMAMYRATSRPGHLHNVYVPEGISVYPNNWAYAMWGFISLPWAIVGLTLTGVLLDRRY
jgi:hypothetical protein